jgi:hypothetical protein
MLHYSLLFVIYQLYHTSQETISAAHRYVCDKKGAEHISILRLIACVRRYFVKISLEELLQVVPGRLVRCFAVGDRHVELFARLGRVGVREAVDRAWDVHELEVHLPLRHLLFEHVDRFLSEQRKDILCP